MPEGCRLLPEMTVFDNIRVGAYRNRDGGKFRQRLDMLYAIFPRLAERRQQVASSDLIQSNHVARAYLGG